MGSVLESLLACLSLARTCSPLCLGLAWAPATPGWACVGLQRPSVPPTPNLLPADTAHSGPCPRAGLRSAGLPQLPRTLPLLRRFLCYGGGVAGGRGAGGGRGVQLRNGEIKFPRCSGPRSSRAVWRGNGDSENPASYFFPYHLAFPLPLSAAGTVNYRAAEPAHLIDSAGRGAGGDVHPGTGDGGAVLATPCPSACAATTSVPCYVPSVRFACNPGARGVLEPAPASPSSAQSAGPRSRPCSLGAAISSRYV